MWKFQCTCAINARTAEAWEFGQELTAELARLRDPKTAGQQPVQPSPHSSAERDLQRETEQVVWPLNPLRHSPGDDPGNHG